uniref:Phage tail tape measure protein n=1 Tax=Phenylobacterium glaciei TaxID=2803784 RepID=A0A974S8E5_9CAUL|nr:hypothetical protein JKL49_00875 [Phenylobacterium glaciei]
MGKMAQKVGVGVAALSQLQYAAELSDLSLEQLGGGLKKLGVNMAGVASGGAQPAAAAFRALGIDVTDANGQLRSTDAVFTDVAGAFGNMADGAGKTALAVQIFGKSGSDLIPLLNSGAKGLAEMRAEADALGLTIDETAARAAEGFNDNLTRLGKVTTGITRQLAAGLAPTLEVVSASLVSAAKDGDFMGAVVATLDIAIRGLVSTGVILGRCSRLCSTPSRVSSRRQSWWWPGTSPARGRSSTPRFWISTPWPPGWARSGPRPPPGSRPPASATAPRSWPPSPRVRPQQRRPSRSSRRRRKRPSRRRSTWWRQRTRPSASGA